MLLSRSEMEYVLKHVFSFFIFFFFLQVFEENLKHGVIVLEIRSKNFRNGNSITIRNKRE